MRLIGLSITTVALFACMVLLSLALELRAGWAALYFAEGMAAAVLAIFLLCMPGGRR